MKRRKFITNTAMAGAAIGLYSPQEAFSKSSFTEQKIRVGFIGVGARGSGQLKLILQRKDISVTALCDIDLDALKRAESTVSKSGQKKPAVYGNGEYDYQNLLMRDDVDAVIISTPWNWHTPMAVDSMNAGKATGLEVAGATNIEECWALVNAYEKTKTPFMILENVCYRRDIMAILAMVRKGLFGEMIHLEGGYQHDLREVKFNDGKQFYGGGVEFGEKGYSEAKWRTKHSVYRNGDIYPTHGLGPIGTYINNNRGNRLVRLTSMASKARGLHEHIINHPAGGKNHPNAKIEFKLGDVIVTNIQTANGETITLTHDTNLPRPYSLGFRVQGTNGLWMALNNSIHIEGKSPSHRWEPAESYLKKYDHILWKKFENEATGAGHGGMDFFVINAFIEALKRKEPMPLDVYDCASWAAITCLSEESIALGNMPMAIPDFTQGKWMNRKPLFGFDDRY